MEALSPEAKLPLLREELQIIEGARQLDGTQSWLVFDPVKHDYFQLDVTSIQILNKWFLQTPIAIIEAIKSDHISLEKIEEVVRFLYQNSLTLEPPSGNSMHYVTLADSRKRSFLSSIFHNYLFFRLSLVHPHQFLQRTLPYTNIFFTRIWWALISCFMISGLLLVSRQWDAFVHTFMHFFNLKGLLFYGTTLVALKILHELGHAYAATRYGCRVPTMGVAFLVMFPVLYTDTTDSWKVRSRKKRLIIDSAGVAVELMLAAIATFLWVFLPEGALKSIAFFVGTTSWIMSIVINLNPLMRFDGYYFFSDAIGVQNLQSRGFAMGRWALREFLFKSNDPKPEAMTVQKERILISYAFATWVYRFFLFLGIAILVHHLFYKPLGLILFFLEIGFFIGIPIIREGMIWWDRRDMYFSSTRFKVTGSILFVLLLLALTPWNNAIRIPASIEAAEQISLHSQKMGKVFSLNVKSGTYVEKGTVLIELVSPELNYKLSQAKRRLILAQARLNRGIVDPQDLEQKVILQREVRQYQQQIIAYENEIQTLNIVAPISGIVVDVMPLLNEGRWLNQDMKVATLISESGLKVRGYVKGNDIARVTEQDEAIFKPYGLEKQNVKGRLSYVSPAHAETITIDALTSRNGGPIAVSEQPRTANPIQAWYAISMENRDLTEVNTTDYLKQSQHGVLIVHGKRESFIMKLWRKAMILLVHETTF